MGLLEEKKATRGHGLLEHFLAKQRAKKVDGMIDDNLRTGRILDIGCGSFPYFLSNINFKEKVGLDKSLRHSTDGSETLKLINFDFVNNRRLPFADDYFRTVTLLAVVEHIENEALLILMKEVYRILKKDGRLLITTPAGWTGGILRLMSKIKLVSSEEIKEHKNLFDKKRLYNFLQTVGFENNKIKVKSWQAGLNLCAIAKK